LAHCRRVKDSSVRVVQGIEQMSRSVSGVHLNGRLLSELGLSHEAISSAIKDTYNLLDRIDETLADADVFPLSQMVELANLSSMIGNLFGSAIAHHSNGLYRRNGPHKYPDLLSDNPSLYPNIEIKMALENNKPKGHLAKPGQYITCRYVLCADDGSFNFDKANRGTTPYIWELRCGYLSADHFNISNTEGDSGKTAVVNAEGMKALKVIYADLDRAPLARRGRVFAEYVALVAAGN
jgi:hypothetical protein